MQKYQFKPTFWLTLFLGSVMLMTISFGYWQLDRAKQKQQLQSAIDSRSTLPPLVLAGAEVSLKDLAEVQHSNGVLRGTWLPEHQFLLENVVYKGKVGFYVYTPMLIADAYVVLVNRGWIAAHARRDQVPTVAPAPDLLQVAGRFAAPRSKPVMVGGLPPANANSQQVWFYVDLALLEIQTGLPVADFVLLQTSADNSQLVRDWPVYDSKVGMHIGYAIQWFAFAGIALVFFVMFSFHRSDAKEK
ncbi:MAG: SURF1 family protein [Gammaproteobacteria bacterium]|jgi:surfeit locus 1 family protein|nr:SURF1 family protein [Gammaproteobacteria bacterium]